MQKPEECGTNEQRMGSGCTVYYLVEIVDQVDVFTISVSLLALSNCFEIA